MIDGEVHGNLDPQEVQGLLKRLPFELVMVEDPRMHIAGPVENTLRARPKPIKLGLSLDRMALMPQVEDYAVGMNEGPLRRAMDPCFTAKSHGKGVGLGISLLQTIEKLNGAVGTAFRPSGGTQVLARIPWLVSRPWVIWPKPWFLLSSLFWEWSFASPWKGTDKRWKSIPGN